VIICGSRHGTDKMRVWNRMAALPKDAIVIEGGAAGVDQLAFWNADKLGLRHETYTAQWGLYGRGAGPRRNQQMLDAGADLVIAFPDAKSKGTLDMIRRARKAGVPVEVIR
jgi:hypothetical protein